MPTPAAHNTFVLESIYAAAPQRVYAALSDPDQKRRWFAEGEGVEDYELDCRVGGVERARSRMGAATPFPGAELTSEGVHLDIVENERVVIAQTMAMNAKRFSAALFTFELFAEGAGTKLRFTHQAVYFEGADGPQIREAGWGALLDRLARALA